MLLAALTNLLNSRNLPLAFIVICSLVIGAVSVHDAILIVLNDDIIQTVELNPMGRWLMDLQDGGVWLFVLTKLAGTSMACALLIRLFLFRPQMGIAMAAAVTFFQLSLLCYLCIA